MTRRLRSILRTVPASALLADVLGVAAIGVLWWAGFFLAGVMQP